MSATAVPDVEDALAWEAEQRPRAAGAAVLAGALTLGGTIIGGVALRGRPSVTLFEALRDAAGQPPPSGGLLADTVRFVHDRAVSLTIAQALTALGAPLTALALVYLFRATRARRPELSQASLVAAVAGAVAAFVGILVGQIAVDVTSADFVASSNHSTSAAHDALQPSAALTAGFIGFLGHVALGLAFVIVALNAMRVGLLTRFMGVLGIMAGVFLAFPFFSVPIVQAFWLVALGVLIAGRWPNGMPPAWESGRAEPWPSRQELLEAQGRARAGAAPPAGASDLEAGGGPEAVPSPHPRSKKKKRRR